MSLRKAIRSAGELLLFLRKYPLDPRSIKQVFAKLKSALDKAEAETVDAVAQRLAPARPRSASLTQDIRKGQDTLDARSRRNSIPEPCTSLWKELAHFSGLHWVYWSKAL